jgi:hypothetical protein
MNTAQINELSNAIQKILPLVVEEWNTKKLPLFESLVEQSFVDYFAGRQTQEKTKMVAPILDSIFYRYISSILSNFEVAEGKGTDYKWNKVFFESKITFSEGNSWTGNGYTKTPWHILMKFNLTEEGHIVSQFAMLANLDECTSKWTAPGQKSNFSTLAFVVEDIQNLIPIIGTVSDKTSEGRSTKKANIRPVSV